MIQQARWSQDITNLYQNNGYLCSPRINPVEVSAVNDTIDFEIRIIEGKETFLNHVTVGGNDKTNDHVIFRELTNPRPGQKYSKDNIVRSVSVNWGNWAFLMRNKSFQTFINPRSQCRNCGYKL